MKSSTTLYTKDSSDRSYTNIQMMPPHPLVVKFCSHLRRPFKETGHPRFRGLKKFDVDQNVHNGNKRTSCQKTHRVPEMMRAAEMRTLVMRWRVIIGSLTLRGGWQMTSSSTGSTPRLGKNKCAGSVHI